ncbi:MAG: maleylacetate reductase [Acidobacteriota bacterium]
MLAFHYQALPSRVVFGPGALQQLPLEIERLGATRALVLCTPNQRDSAEQIVALLKDRAAGIFDQAVMHVPIESAEAARAKARLTGADCCVAIGGGSTTGLAKAIALTSELPILAIPTTYAGSEMTPIWGLTEAGMKKTGRDLRVLPRTVIYDPDLTLTLPPAMSVTSGINAMAHCVEALYAPDANPITSLMAEDAIRAISTSLPKIVQNPSDPEARAQALYGAWLGGSVLGTVGMALHHKLCHTLGGSFGLPHAETHTVILPHALAYNAPAVPDAIKRLSSALQLSPSISAAQGIFDLAQRLGAPISLEQLGMLRKDLDSAAALATLNPYFNPRRITCDGIRGLLEDAFTGRRPAE